MKTDNDNFSMIAKTFAGLENVLADELEDLGAQNIEILKRAVKFSGNTKLMYEANYWCRTALRILKTIEIFEVNNESDLYNNVKKIKWWKYFDLEKTFAVNANINNSVFNNSTYVALKTKDAVVDLFREKFDKRPNIDRENPDIVINVHIFKNNCTLSLDSSGRSLDKRGYKLFNGDAPINEVLAAGMVLLSKWNKETDFLDPMCGSGTIIIEAALYAYNIAPGNFRKNYAFMNWADFDLSTWNKIVDDSYLKFFEFRHNIIGGDVSQKMCVISYKNIKNAKLHNDIEVYKKAFEDTFVYNNKVTIITNPPYGERLIVDDIVDLYKNIGDTLKKNYNGNAWIISSDISALKHIGLKPSKKIVLFNGQLECRFVKFEIYKGSKRINMN